MAAAQGLLEAARQACRRSGRAPCSARSRRRRARAPKREPIRSGSSASSGLNDSLARRERAAVEPGDEHLVEADAACARAAEHPEDVVADRARDRSRPGRRAPSAPRARRWRSRGRRRPRPGPAAARARSARTSRPCRSARAGRARARGSWVATASGQPCSPVLAMSATRMLPGTNSQRALSARWTLLSSAHGVGSSSVTMPWTCLTMSHVMLVSVPMPIAVRARPGAVQPPSEIAPTHRAATRPAGTEGAEHGRAWIGPRAHAARQAHARRWKTILASASAPLSVNKRPEALRSRNTMCTSGRATAARVAALQWPTPLGGPR